MKIIFDTDMGCDCDDVTALCLLLSAQRRGECEVCGVTMSIPYPASIKCAGAVLAQYGFDDIPIGALCPPFDGYYPPADVYAGGVADKFPNSAYAVSDAVSLIRVILAGSDEKVTLLATGPQPNIAALLDSVPDDISPLDGWTLVAQKVSEIVVMGGDFSHQNGFNRTRADGKHTEFNITLDIKGAQRVLEKSPVDVVYLPFEVGNKMISGGEMVKKLGADSPSSLALILHGSEHGRDSWDPASALYAVCGLGDDFGYSPRGVITVNDDGSTDFNEKSGGRHRYLTCARPQSEIGRHIDAMIE